MEWIDTLLRRDKPTDDFDSGLGRLSSVCGALIYNRPFLPPLCSLAASIRSRAGRKEDATKLPPYVVFILMHLAERQRSLRTVYCLTGRPKGHEAIERFRTDAKAEGGLVTIGGYQTADAIGLPIEHAEARWFFIKLDRTTSPWAFARGEPFRALASLELLGRSWA